MPVTKDQAQMLAALAVASRPYRAPTWDEAGVVSAIAEIRNMSLPEVILRVIRAAADRDAKTPGVIPKNGPHAQEQLKPPKWEPDSHDAHERCSTCDLRPAECRRRWAGDHEYVARSEVPNLDAARAVAALRDIKATEPPPERPQPARSTKGTEHVAPIRAALAKEAPDHEETA